MPSPPSGVAICGGYRGRSTRVDPYMLSTWKWLGLRNSVKGPGIPARLWLITSVVVFWSLVLDGFEGRVVVVVFNCYFK